MESFKLYNKRTGDILIKDLKLADTFTLRLRGLMGRTISPAEGLMIFPCNSIHCLFMRMPIDVLFLDSKSKVIHKIDAMKPWRISPIIKNSKMVIEASEGMFQSVERGDEMAFL